MIWNIIYLLTLNSFLPSLLYYLPFDPALLLPAPLALLAVQ